MGKKQREGIRRTALECLEHYELIIRRIRNLCADFDAKDLIDPGSMALQLRLLFIDSSSRTGGRSVMNLMGVTNAQRILSTVPQRISESTFSSMVFLGLRGLEAGSVWVAPFSDSHGVRNLLTTKKWLGFELLHSHNQSLREYQVKPQLFAYSTQQIVIENIGCN